MGWTSPEARCKWREENPEKVKKHKRQYYLKYRDKLMSKQKKYYEDNKEIVLKKDKIRKLRVRSQIGDKAYQEYRRNIELKYLFGITLEDYNNLKKKQNYKCAICDTEKSSEGRDFHVDHCHTTGKVRGLLCSRCNTALGSFKDSIDTLKRAIKYLEI